MLFEDTFEKTQWGKVKQMSGEQVYYNHLRQLGELTLIVEEMTQFSGEMIKLIMI